MLTPKQEKFCQCIVSGMSGKDSYQAAYDCQSDNAAMVESTKLLKRDDITAKITELRKPLENLCVTKAITERERKRQWLWDMINNVNAAESDRLRAMDLLNKMDSEYMQVNVNENKNTITLDNIDLSTLKTLSNSD